MKDKLRHICKNFNQDMLSNILYTVFVALVVVVAIWIFADSPVQPHFREAANNNVWFGDGWHYADKNGNIDWNDSVAVNGQHFMRVNVDDGVVRIAKRVEKKPSAEDFFCFRTCAHNVKLYVNGSCWYEYEMQEKYKKYSKGMYMLHQLSAADLEAGDVITLVLLDTDDSNYTILQYPAIGDRYALTKYIIAQSAINLLLCVFVLILLLLIAVTRHSPILVERMNNKESLKWLWSFLVVAMIYFGMDTGCMELLFNRMYWVGWLGDVAVLMLPMPFLLYTKNVFFPDYRRFEYLAGINFIIAVASIIGFIGWGYNISDAFIFIHPLIAVGITMCLVSLIKEEQMPGAEVLIGYAAIWISSIAAVWLYWTGLAYPLSTVFGIGLAVFGVCMLLWTVKENNELKRLRDEVERIRMQRDKQNAEEANEQKSRFLSQMSHEIRTPLNAMLGMNELIMQSAENSTTKQYAANIQSAGRTLLALINDVLDFSKIENGKLNIEIYNYSLSSVLNDVILMVQEKVTAKGLELRLNIDSDMPDSLRGDEIRIKQIILNLLTNAVKYTERGWVKLSVGLTPETKQWQTQGDICMCVRVSDSGIGIKEEEMPKLFREFERLDRNRNRSIEGTGLGLSITSRLAALMGGSIKVESEYGKGSTFTVFLPQAVVSDESIGDYKKRIERLTKSEQQESPQTLKFSGKRVFVVDDNEMNLEVIASILEMLEITVSRADNGQSAINRLENDKYDLIITDDMMPGMSGNELMKRIKSHMQGANCSTPVVVLTANAIAGAREEYLKRGFDGYLTKPIDIDALQKLLQRYLH